MNLQTLWNWVWNSSWGLVVVVALVLLAIALAWRAVAQRAVAGTGATDKIVALGLGALLLVFGPPLLFISGALSTEQVVAIVLLGILSMLGVLLSFAMMMKLVGISDPAQALGMPEGSVRAMLALALIGLFAVLAAVVFETPTAVRSRGVDAAAVTAFRAANPDLGARAVVVPESGGTFRIEVSGTPRVVDDFVKTTMASVATLMTAIVAFYFGGRSVEIAQGKRVVPPSLTGLLSANPYSMAKGPMPLRLGGRGLNDVRRVRLKQSGRVVVEASVPTSNDTEVTCDVAVSAATTPPGAYDVEVLDGAGNASELKGALQLVP